MGLAAVSLDAQPVLADRRKMRAARDKVTSAPAAASDAP